MNSRNPGTEAGRPELLSAHDTSDPFHVGGDVDLDLRRTRSSS
jgi:hypothetical protein